MTLFNIDIANKSFSVIVSQLFQTPRYSNFLKLFLFSFYFYLCRFSLCQVCEEPSPTRWASIWASSPSRRGSWLAPPPSSSCSSPSCSWGAAPCRLSELWTLRKASRAARARKTSIWARRRKWCVVMSLLELTALCTHTYSDTQFCFEAALL